MLQKVCDCYHDMTEKVMSFNDFVIAPATRNDYRMNIWFMSKSEAFCRIKNADLSKKKNNYDYRIIIFYSDIKL